MKKLVLLGVAAAFSTGAFASLSINENFDSLVTPALPAGWLSVNNSPGGPGTNPNWATRNDIVVFPAQSGTNFAFANYNASTGANDISLYMITTVQSVNAGDTLSFWTRTVNTPAFPDRMSVLHSTNGGTNPADFTVTDLVINPNLTTTGYPNVWTQYSITYGSSFNGAIAFWYNVTGGGPSGSNSDFIGVDTITSTPVPEPASFLAIGAGVAALALARRRRK